MANEKKIFVGGLDRDSDLRFVKNGDYRDALNVNVFSTEENGEVGVVSNMKGAEEILRYTGVNYFGSEHEVIGAIEDPSFDRIIFFVAYIGVGEALPSEEDCIVEYNLKTNECYTLVRSNYLNFNSKYRVNDAHIIGHKEDFSPEGILYFTDNYNPPRRINISEEKLNSANGTLAEIVPSSGGKKKYRELNTGFEFDGVNPTLMGFSGLGLSLDERINAARIAPLVKPGVTLTTDESIKSNYIKGKAFKFKYRYQYRDKQFSAWSPVSEMVATENLTPQMNGTINNLSSDNLIKVSFVIPNSDIESIEVAVRDLTNSDTYGLSDTLSFNNQNGFYHNGNKVGNNFMVGGYQSSELNNESNNTVSIGGLVEYYFYNNEIYPAIDLRDSTKLFNNIPIKSKTQSLLDGGRLAYGNVVTGRNGHDAKLNVRRYDAGDLVTDSQTAPVEASASCQVGREVFDGGPLCSSRVNFNAMYTVKIKFNQLPEDAGSTSYNVIINKLPFTYMMAEDTPNMISNNLIGYFNLFSNAGNPPGTPGDFEATTLATTFYNSVVSNLTGGQIGPGVKIDDTSFTGNPMLDIVNQDQAYLRAGHVNIDLLTNHCNSTANNANCNGDCSDAELSGLWDGFTEGSFIELSGDEIIFRWSVINNGYNQDKFKQPFRRHHCYAGINQLEEFVGVMSSLDIPSTNAATNVVAENIISNINTPNGHVNTTNSSFNGYNYISAGSEYDWIDRIESLGANLSDYQSTLDAYNAVATSNATLNVAYTQTLYTPVAKGFKTGAWHNFGIVYYDKQGRSSSVQSKTSLYIPSHLENNATTTIERSGVEWNIAKKQAPSWADTYQIVYTGNRNIQKFEQFVTLGFSSSTLFPDLIFVETDALKKSVEACGGKGVNSEFSPGDRVRILNTGNADTNAIIDNSNFDFQIADIVKVKRYLPTQNDDSVTDITSDAAYDTVEILGQFLNVTRTLHSDSGIAVPTKGEIKEYLVLNKSDFNTSDVYKAANSLAINANAKILTNAVLEIYSPKKELDDDELIFFEFDKSHNTITESIPLLYCNFVEGSTTVTIDAQQYPNGIAASYIAEGTSLTNSIALPYGAVIEYINTQIVGDTPQVTSFVISTPSSSTINSLGALETTFKNTAHGTGYSTDSLDANGVSYANDSSSNTEDWIKLLSSNDQPNGDVYTRIRRNRVGGSIVVAGIESYHFSDYFKSDFWNSGRANKELESYHESRKPNTIIYTDSIIGNTYVNGLNSSFENEYFAEFDKSNGTIQKIFAKNNYIIIFQQDKILKAFVERNMNFTASGAGNLALSSEIISKSVPYAWEGGIGNHPESFANYGDVIYFFDSQRGECLKIQNDQVSLISDKGMSSYFSNKSKQLSSMGSNAHIIGGYDVSKAEYVISFEGEFIEEDVELCDLASEEYWSATETYDAGTVVSYALSTAEQATSGVAEINYIAFVQNTNTSPYNNSAVVTSATVTSSNALWSIGDTIAIPSASNTSSTSEGVITVNSVSKPVGSVSINAPGSGYEVNDILSVDGDQNYNSPLLIKVLSIGTNGVVTSLSIQDGGDFTGFNIPTVGLIASAESDAITGFGLTVDIEYLSTGQILDYSLTDQGEYTQASSNYTPSIEDGDKIANLSVVSQGAWTLCSGLGAQIGCTDSIANNYSSVAIFDDGSCNYDCLGVVFDDGCGSISAVSTPSTVNLDEILSSNLVDQASGIITYSITNSCEGNTLENAYYTIIIRDGQVILFDTNHGSSVVYSGLLAGFYNFLTIDTNSILGNINSFTLPTGFTDPLSTELPDDTLLSNTQVLYNIIQDCGVGTEVTVQLLGCDNSIALNNVQGYTDGIVINPTSIEESDPCIFDIPGCTNVDAANYEPIATLDDGSCVVCEQNDVNNLFGVFAPNVTGLDSTTFNIEVSITDEAEGNEAWNPQYVITVFKGNVSGEIVFQESYLDINTYTEVGTGGTVYINDLDLIDGSQLQEYVVRVEAVDACTVDQIVVPGWDGCQTEGSLNYNSLATDPVDCIDCTYVNSQVSISGLSVGGQPTGLAVAGDVNNDNSVTVSIIPGNLESLNSGVQITYLIELYDGISLLEEYTIFGYNTNIYQHTFDNVYFEGLGSTEYTVYLTVTSTYNNNTLTCYDQQSVNQQLYGCNSTTLDFNGVSLSTENYNELATANNGTCYTCQGLTISNESVSPETNGDSTGVYTFKVEDVYGFVNPVNININGGETSYQLSTVGIGIEAISNPFNYNTLLNGDNGQITISGLTSGSFTIELSYDSSSIASGCTLVSSSFTIANEIPGCQDTTAQNYNNSDYGTVNTDSTTFPDSCQFCLPSCSWSQETIVNGTNYTGNDPLIPTNIQGGLFNVITNNTDVPGSLDGSIEFQLIRGSFVGGWQSWQGADAEIQAFIDLMEAGGQVRFTLYSDENYANSIDVKSLSAADFQALTPQYAISNAAPLTVATFSNLDGYGDDGLPTEYFYEIEYLVVPQNELTSTSSFFSNNTDFYPFSSSCPEEITQVQYKFLQGCKYQYSTVIQDSSCPSNKDILGGQSDSYIFSNSTISYNTPTINSLFLLNHANSVNSPTLESGSLTLQGSNGFNPNFWADSQQNGGSIQYVEYKLYPNVDTYSYFGGTGSFLHTLIIGYNADGTVNTLSNSPSALAQNNGNGYFNGDVISATVSDLGGGDYNFTYSGLPPSTYRLRLRKNFGDVSVSICQTMLNDIEVLVHGCNNSTATNSYTNINNSGLNSSVLNSIVNDECGAVCCMPEILDCNDNTATNTVSPPSGYGVADTVISGDIVQEFNFPSGASSYLHNFPVTGDDSCYIAGCMNTSATNYNPNATAPCDESGTYSVNNIADNSCCTGCIDPTALNYNITVGSDYSGVVGGTDYSGCQYLYEADGETLFNNDSIQLDRVVGCNYIYQSTGNEYLVDSQITLSNFPIVINGAGDVIEENNLNTIYVITDGNSNVIYNNEDINTSEVSFNYTSSSNTTFNGQNIGDFLFAVINGDYGNYNPFLQSISSNITEAVQLLDAELVTPSTAEIQNAQGQACSIEYPTETFSGNTWFLKSASGSSANNGTSINQRLYEDAGFNQENGGVGVTQYIDFECLNVFADTGCPVKDLGYEVINQSTDSEIGFVFDQGNVKGSFIAPRQGDIEIRLFLVDEDGNEIVHNQGDVLHSALYGNHTLSTNLSPFSWNIKYQTTSSNDTTGEFTASLEFFQNNISGKKINIDASSQNRVLATAWCPPTLDGLELSAEADYGNWANPVVGAPQSNWLGLWCDQSTTELNGVTITDVNNI